MRLRKLEVRLGLKTKPTWKLGTSAINFQLRKPQFDSYLLELPQHLELMSALLENGEGLYGTLISIRARGQFAAAMDRLSFRLQHGEDLERALELLSRETKSPAVAEFSSKLQLSLIRGTPVAEQFLALAESSRAQLRNDLLRKAGVNEVKMLVPLVFVILPITIAFALFPSFQLLQIGI